MTRNLVVLLGGTFDPVHIGHLHAAQAARRALRAPAATLVLSARPPHRAPVASAAQRWEMLRLAVADEDGLEASDAELARRGASYSADTIAAFAAPRRSVAWLLGSDGLRGMLAWHRAATLPRSCHLVVLARPGVAPTGLRGFRVTCDPGRLRQRRGGLLLPLQAPMLDVSATEARRRLAVGLDAASLLKPAVWQYIKQRDLYRR